MCNGRPLTVKCPSVHNLTIAVEKQKKKRQQQQRVSNENQAGSERS